MHLRRCRPEQVRGNLILPLTFDAHDVKAVQHEGVPYALCHRDLLTTVAQRWIYNETCHDPVPIPSLGYHLG